VDVPDELDGPLHLVDAEHGCCCTIL
jgi:hypothetical protein